MSQDRVVIADQAYTGDTLLDGRCFIENSIAGDELAIDTLDATLNFSILAPTLFQPKDAKALLTADGDLFGVMPYVYVLVGSKDDFTYGDEVFYYHGDELIGKFYMESILQISQTFYAITCVSAVGLLERSDHSGGIYTGESFRTVLADIIGGRFPYTLDSEIGKLAVYGWLPFNTRRDNLHQLLFAFGVSVQKARQGDPHFTKMTGEDSTVIASDRLYLGGDISTAPLATSVRVTEHQYIAHETSEEKILFEGDVISRTFTSPKGQTFQGDLVKFSAPMHSLSVSNSEVLESGANYAVLKPGSHVVLSGKEYTHITRAVSRDKPSVRSLVSIQDNELSADSCTLISPSNSEDVADRLMAYFGYAETVSNELIVGKERPGNPVAFEDPFHKRTQGFIQSMDITMSGVLKASSTIVTGYVPPKSQIYTRSVILTEQGTWTVPVGVTRIRVVLIGGGDGGASGAPGQAGTSSGKGGTPGVGGEPGQGGKILILSLDVTPGQSFSFSPGQPGTGGVCDGTQSVPGGVGGATTFGLYSSEDGSREAQGYSELFGGELYALPGQKGREGGAGRDYNDTSEPRPLDPERDSFYPGNNGLTREGYGATAYGGGGGGAAYWNDISHSFAGNGGDGRVSEDSTGTVLAAGGYGGAGADGGEALQLMNYKRDPLTPIPQGVVWTPLGSGQGGYGGHGGGGGGGGGQAKGGDSNWPGAGGKGGSGGNGSDGFPGCVIIYLP